jgi:hypothetical protein
MATATLFAPNPVTVAGVKYSGNVTTSSPAVISAIMAASGRLVSTPEPMLQDKSAENAVREAGNLSDAGAAAFRAAIGACGESLPGIVLIGSSTFANETEISGNTYTAYGPVVNGLTLSGCNAHVIANLAVGGTGMTELEAQFATALAMRPAAIIAQPFSNDVFAGATAAELWPRFLALIQRASAAGVPFVGRITHNRTGSTSQDRAALVALRNLLRQATVTYPRFYTVDAWQVIIDGTSATGEPQSNVLFDGTHESNLGAFLEGKEWAKLFNVLFPPVPFPQADSVVANGVVNYVVNPALSGTGGTAGTGASGTIPSNVTVSRFSGTGTIASSVVSRGNGRNAIRLTVSGGVSGDIFLVKFAHAATIAGNYEMGVQVLGTDVANGHQPRLTQNAAGIAILNRSGTAGNRKALGTAANGTQWTLRSKPVAVAAADTQGLDVYLYQLGSGAQVVELENPYFNLVG